MTAQPQKTNKHLLSTADYHKMAEAGILAQEERMELINGEIIDMTPIGSRHAGHVNYLNSVFTAALQNTALVAVQNPIILGEYSEPEPDIAILRHRDDFYINTHPTATDIFLICEVADSSLSYDQNVKMKLYSQHAIPETWLIDVENNKLVQYRNPTATEYASVTEIKGYSSLNIAAFPNHEIDLSKLFG